jgi:predicted RNase H-like HicB family nuclease
LRAARRDATIERMRCSVTLRRDGAGILATCGDYPSCEGRGATADEALAKLREALAFWLELCPCDVTTAPGLVLTVVRDETRA